MDRAYGDEFTRNLTSNWQSWHMTSRIDQEDCSLPWRQGQPPGRLPPRQPSKPAFILPMQFRSPNDRGSPGIRVAASWISSLARHAVAEGGRRRLHCRWEGFWPDAASIHLVGKNTASFPTAQATSRWRSCRMSWRSQDTRKRGLRRILSLPEGTRSDSALQQDFIERLLKGCRASIWVDLVTGDTEELKGAVHEAPKKSAKTGNLRL